MSIGRKITRWLLAAHALAGTGQAATWDWRDSNLSGDRLAEYRLWLPDDVGKIRSVVALLPGYGGDARGNTEDKEWQALAQRTHSALLGCHHAGTQGGYYWQQAWAPRSLKDAQNALATLSAHPELARAPVALWGMSAGGCFNYLFALTFPKSTIAFVVNRSGGNLEKRVSDESRQIPALFFLGSEDTPERYDDLTMAFAIERRKGAPWGLVVEIGTGHVVAGSKALGILFLETVITQRVGEDGRLKPISLEAGWLGNLENHAIEPVTGSKWPQGPTTAWLPSQVFAQAWQKAVAPPAKP